MGVGAAIMRDGSIGEVYEIDAEGVMYEQTSSASLKVFSSEPEQAAIWLDGRGARLYFPGETLAGSYSIAGIRHSSVGSVEVSVMWETEGKGNEDFGVHYFLKLSCADGDWIDPLSPGRFSTILPRSPMSYEGNLIKLRWYARVRVFLANGEELVDEVPFRLGEQPDMRALKLCAEPGF